jgi:multicomponent Na+:H+ antiporter subunit D
MPPFSTAAGKSLFESAFHGGMGKLVLMVMLVSSAITGGAVLRAGARIFFGWGTSADRERESPTERRSQPETSERPRWIPFVMLAPAAALVALHCC